MDGQQLAGPFNIFGTILNSDEATLENAEFVAARTNVVLIADPTDSALIAKIKATNPSAKILYFTSPWFGSAADEALYGLVDSNDDPILYAGPVYEGIGAKQVDRPLLDMQNAAWRAEFSTRCAVLTALHDIDGVVLDPLNTAYPAHLTDSIYPKNYVEATWESDVTTFATAIDTAMGAKEVWFNGMTRAPGDGQSVMPDEALLTLLDGTALESFGVNSNFYADATNKEYFANTTVLTDLKSIQDDGKEAIVEVYLDKTNVRASLYALGCISLIQSGNISLNLTTNNEAGRWKYRDEWGMPLGAATGAYTTNPDGSHQRGFTGGTVYVNPTGLEINGAVKIPAYSAVFSLS